MTLQPVVPIPRHVPANILHLQEHQHPGVGIQHAGRPKLFLFTNQHLTNYLQRLTGCSLTTFSQTQESQHGALSQAQPLGVFPTAGSAGQRRIYRSGHG